MAVACVALPVAVDQPFDYWIPDGLQVGPGSIVRVRLAGRRLAGVVVETRASSTVAAERLQPLEEVVAALALPADLLDAARFIAAYYQEPLGQALALMLPPLRVAARPAREAVERVALTAAGRAQPGAKLARAPAARALFERLAAAPAGLELRNLGDADKRRLRAWVGEGFAAPVAAAAVAAHAPNAAQAAAIEAVTGALGGYAPMLLDGVTGSGKTQVYLAAATAAIARGGQVLILVPEINLTPQFEARVRAALPGVSLATLHSGLADGARRAHWDAAASGRAQLVLGTRLAVFAPLPALALIVVDEEHDGSYKQQDGLRYQARDVAVWRAHRRGVPVLLGSATPSLESFAHAAAGRYRRLELPARADPRARPPRVALVPNRDAAAREGIAGPLWTALAACVARGEQALVFVNRRGYAPSLKCAACGWEAGCPRCSARLTVHRTPGLLRCHHCGHAARLPAACPDCGNVDLLPLGFGTQRLERALSDGLPGARIARVDRDSTRARGAFAALRRRVEDAELDVLIGTQMLAKGHDFPRLTLVGVLGADNALYSADFRATERLAALLMQVAGRAGRAGLPGEVIVQTDFADHPVFAALAAHDYDRFARRELALREAAALPPVTHVALLLAESEDRADVDRFLERARAAALALPSAERAGVEVFAPVPALMARRAGLERGQVVVQAHARGALQRFLPRWREALAAVPAQRVRVAIDVDPAGFG